MAGQWLGHKTRAFELAPHEAIPAMSAEFSINCRGFVHGIAALTASLLVSACGEPTIVDIMRGIDASDGGDRKSVV